MDKKIKGELMFVFSQLHIHHLKLISKELIEEVKNGFDKDVFYSFKKSKPFTEQELSEETLEILDGVFSKIPDEDFE